MDVKTLNFQTMIGNDIVDLKTANRESNWQRSGYLQKIYTSEEQFLILNSKNSELMLWVIWSIKESVYKANFRKNPVYEYAPLNFKISNLNQKHDCITAKTEFQKSIYYTTTQINRGFIHSMACEFEKDLDNINKIEVEDYSENYIEDLKANKLISSSEDIKKDEFGIPMLLNLKNNLQFPLSISHHGRYLGIIWSFNHTI